MRRFLPSLSALQAFDSAARHRSFTRAADDLGLTQSGISRQIGNLETSLGNKLFERIGSRLVLTDVGRSYAAEVHQALDRLEEISLDAIRGRKASAGILLGSRTSFAARWLIPRLQSFVAACPDIPLELVDLGNGGPFDDGRVDIAVLRGLGEWPNARIAELFREQLVVVASPALIEDIGPVTRLDFQRLPTLQNASRHNLWLTWLRAAGHAHSGAIRGLRFPSSDMVIRAAVEGLGLAVVPVNFVAAELAQRQLVPIFGGPVPSGESYWALIPEGKAGKPNLFDVRAWLIRTAKAGDAP